MATDLLTARDNPMALISLPDLQRLRRISMGTVVWTGMPMRRYLAGGSILSTEDRARAEQLLAEIKVQMLAPEDSRRSQFGLISKMLLTYPVANASAETGAARGAAYLDALDDVPPVMLAQAIRRWNRGEAGDHDYRWAPAPAVLRGICLKVMEPLREAEDDLQKLLSAISLDRAMDPTPIEAPAGLPKIRSM